jgi:response regulator RpfG family c-di-GMP phosphodiesterase
MGEFRSPPKEIVTKEGEPEGKIRLLIVEDEPHTLKFLKRLAEETVGDYEVTITDNTADALRILRESGDKGRPIELVFSGLELMDESEGGLKMSRQKLTNRFILCTSSVDKFRGWSKKQLKNEGIDILIPKPSSFEALRECFINEKKILRPARTSR